MKLLKGSGPQLPTGARIWSIFSPIMPNKPNIPKTQILGALLTASIQTCIQIYYPDWKKMTEL